MWFNRKPIAPQRSLGLDPADSHEEIAELHRRFDDARDEVVYLSRYAREQCLQLRDFRRSRDKHTP